ncbi:MAG: DUF4870 domain-containing protein [Spirochaetaceae bacterium]|nr:DUF4870 domain-containing protein [Spirochaetaceae bacterium]
MNEQIIFPQPEEVSAKDKENGFGTYIMMFAGAYLPLPFIEIVMSLVYYYYYKKRSRYVTFHAYQSFLAQIPVTIINTALVIYGIKLLILFFKTEVLSHQSFENFLTFLIIVIIINIIYIIESLIIAFKAKKGIFAYFPIFGKIAFNKLYGPDAIEIGFKASVQGRNRTPD